MCTSWDVGIFKEQPTLVSYFCFGCGHRFDVAREAPKKKAPRKIEEKKPEGEGQ
jgi:hypothetical protein